MGADVLTAYVRDELLITELLDVQDQAVFLAVVISAVSLGTEEQAEFERHVKARQAVGRIELRAGEVMYPIPAFANQARDLVDPHLAAVVEFESATRLESAVDNCEDDRPEQVAVPRMMKTLLGAD